MAALTPGCLSGGPQQRAVTLWTARTLVTDWCHVTLRSSWHSWSRGGAGTAPGCARVGCGLEGRLFLHLVPLIPVLLPQSQTRLQEKTRPVSCSRQTMKVKAGRCSLFLETPSGAFSHKGFSLSTRKLLLEVAIIPSTSRFNKKPKFAFSERGGKHKIGVFGLEPVEQLGSAQGWPPASLFLLRDNGSSEAGTETGNQHAGKSARCMRSALDKIHTKHSPGHNTTKNSETLKSEE